MTAEPAQARTDMLVALIDTLNRSEVPYCILHGYLSFPDDVPSDVDCLLPTIQLPGNLARLLHRSREQLDATLVQWLRHQATAHYFVLARRSAHSRPHFIAFDACSDYRVRGARLYRGADLLRDCRLYNGFPVPSPAREFGYYLVKKVAKETLTDEHGRRLSELYHQDAAGCEREIAGFWKPDSARLIGAAARAGAWDPVAVRLPELRRELVRARTPGGLVRTLGYWARDLVRRIRRFLEPTGVHVVLLGPDGAGKSTVAAVVREHLAPAFRRTTIRHLRPGLVQRVLAGPLTPPSAPHSRAPRSLAGSLAKTVFWLLDYTLGYYASVRPELVRSTLVLFDRYLLDVLVDARRYRYGGPPWLVRALWRVVPKPDLVILLDAPAEVLQGRKLEVSPEETARQREAYRALVGSLPNGHLVDAARPVEQVAAQVDAIVLDFLTRRTTRRLGIPG
jgi:thymidylate kinase